VRRRFRSFVAAVAAAALSTVSAIASPPTPALTTIDVLTADLSGSELTVDGAVTFGGEFEQIIETDPLNDWANDPDAGFVGGPLGVDITELVIHRPAPARDEVEFVIKVAQLEVPPPNEVIRYLWEFTVDGVEYWIQAKMSDVASGTTFVDDPEGAVMHTNGAFRLRGDCQVIGIVATCVHLMWIDGVFDVQNDEIRMTVPLNDARAPHLVEGAVIGPVADAVEVTAGIQVLISNASTTDGVDVVAPYTIAGRSASLGIAPAGADVADVVFDTEASTVGTGGFDHAFDVSGLAAGDYEVFARACFGDNCGVSSAPFTI